MDSLVNNCLFPLAPDPQRKEVEYLLSEIEDAKEKLEQAWNHFEYAAPEYVELAVLELLLAENRYCLLNKRYRLLLGLSQTPLTLDGCLQRHAF